MSLQPRTPGAHSRVCYVVTVHFTYRHLTMFKNIWQLHFPFILLTSPPSTSPSSPSSSEVWKKRSKQKCVFHVSEGQQVEAGRLLLTLQKFAPCKKPNTEDLKIVKRKNCQICKNLPPAKRPITKDWKIEERINCQICKNLPPAKRPITKD